MTVHEVIFVLDTKDEADMHRLKAIQQGDAVWYGGGSHYAVKAQSMRDGTVRVTCRPSNRSKT